MKAELRVAKHTEIRGAHSVEVWYNGKLVGVVFGADGPGIRYVSKFKLEHHSRMKKEETGFDIQELLVKVEPDAPGS